MNAVDPNTGDTILISLLRSHSADAKEHGMACVVNFRLYIHHCSNFFPSFCSVLKQYKVDPLTVNKSGLSAAQLTSGVLYTFCKLFPEASPLLEQEVLLKQFGLQLKGRYLPLEIQTILQLFEEDSFPKAMSSLARTPKVEPKSTRPSSA